MSGELGRERVVVIQDASREVSPSAIRGIAQGLSLHPGDALKFLVIVHHVNSPLGYKIRLDSSSMFRTNQKIVEEEISRKKEEYQNNEEIVKISNQYETEKIEFHVEVLAGSSLKTLAVRSAKRFKATWVILDRHIKKEKGYFLENLLCRISRMKRDNSIEQLRGQKAKSGSGSSNKLAVEKSPDYHGVSVSSASGSTNKLVVEKSPDSDGVSVSYHEMIAGSTRRKTSQIPQKANSTEEKGGEFGEESPWQSSRKSSSFYKSSGSSYTENTCSPFLQFHEEYEEDTFSIDLTKEYRGISDSENLNLKKRNENSRYLAGSPMTNEVFENSICTVCENRRPKIGWKRHFSYGELQAATEGFSDKNYLSEGGFGSVYRGEINGMKIAVKRNKNASFQGDKEFKSEVQVLSKARHQNLVMLLGTCSEGNHRLLVYEYVCNGSLDQHLSMHARTPLSWEKRMKIAMGAAKGLQYLHENNIIHREMRPSNILVTHDFETLLGDFGLARTQREGSEHSSETGVVGTLGYLDPENVERGKVSTKTDVYSFGVVLLQLITGLKTTDKKLGGRSLVGWARSLLKERKYPDLIDPRILDCHDVHQLLWMARVTEKCLCKDPQKRLSMDTVVDALKCIMESDAISNIRGLSPAPSDSVSSSCGSEASESSPVSQSEDASRFTVDNTPTSGISHLSVRFPPTPPIQTRGMLPPSPPLPALSSDFYSNKKPENSPSRGAVPYDETYIWM